MKPTQNVTFTSYRVYWIQRRRAERYWYYARTKNGIPFEEFVFD